MANTSPFQTVSELQSPHLDFGFLSMQNYFSAHTTSETKDLNLYLFPLEPLLGAPSFTSLPSLQPWQMAYLCSQLQHHCRPLFVVVVHKYHFFLAWLSLPGIDLVHHDTEICHSTKFFSKLYFQIDVWKQMFKTSFILLASTSKALPIPCNILGVIKQLF